MIEDVVRRETALCVDNRLSGLSGWIQRSPEEVREVPYRHQMCGRGTQDIASSCDGCI